MQLTSGASELSKVRDDARVEGFLSGNFPGKK